MMHQAGILDALPQCSRYLSFSVRNAHHLPAALNALREHVDGVRTVVGIGQALVLALNTTIPGLRDLPALTGPGVAVPSTPFALWLWLRGDDRGELFQRGRALTAALAPALQLEQAIDGFRHDVGRDLTGYEDGTENPVDAEAATAALVAPHFALAGSSFVAVQQWLHCFPKFDAMTGDEQDNAIGRRRRDNEELDDAPPSAHTKRTAQESFEPEAFVVRRSMPYVEGENAGLMFVAFGHSFDAFEAQVRRMVGLEDGITDALFRFTTPISGAYFWCPAMKHGKLNLAPLNL